MKERNLVICDPEIRYAQRLGENISEREELAVKVHICSSFQKAQEFAQKKSIQILMIDESVPFEERILLQASFTFVLGGNGEAAVGEEEYFICKYQSADEIIREIFSTYVEQTNENLLRSKRNFDTRIIGIYSPIHRVGKTTFAMALGRACAKSKKVLYLNLEEYAAIEDCGEKGWGLEDLLYYVKQGDQNLGVRMRLAIRKSGELEYLLPMPISQDLKEVTKEEWEDLLKIILKMGTYELVILDFGESIQGLFSLLNECDRIYTPILEDVISQRKLEKYENNIERLAFERISQITYRFVMPENVEEYAKMRAKEEC